MQLVDRHVIRKNNSMWAEIDDLAFRSKNLYNLANYHVRQSFIFKGLWLRYGDLDKLLQSEDT